MRSKKIRIVVTGGFLSLLAVAIAVRKGSVSQSQHLSSATHHTHVASASAEAPTTSGDVKASAAQNGLLKYVEKPASVGRLEKMMTAPSHDVRYAKIESSLVRGPNAPLAKQGSHVTLTMPDGATLPVKIDRTRVLGDGRYVSEGSIEGEKQGRAVFAYNNGEMSAVVDDMEHGSYQIRSVGDSTSQVFKVDGTLVPPCDANAQKMAGAQQAIKAAANAKVAGDVWTDGSTQVDPAQADSTSNGWGNTEIRVLVPYSRVIETVMSTDSIQNWIDLAVGALNNDFSRSGVPVTVTLVGAPSLQYDQEFETYGGGVLLALQRLANSGDGIMDDVNVMRTDTQADLVCFAMCQPDPNNSGVGYILQNAGDAFNATYGFSVVTFWYMNSNSTFSHEIGHNLGCNHDRDNAASVDGTYASGTYAYSYGYRFYGNDGQQYRTIMAYPPGNVVPYFSNPNLNAWDPISTPVGAPLGEWDQAYNALTITQNAAEVSNYHSSRLLARITRRLRGW